MNVVPKKEGMKIDWDEFGGLDLLPDTLSRPFNSWSQAYNCDLYVPGSIRKVVGPQKYVGPFPTIIVEMLAYERSSTDTLIRIAVGLNGHFYNFDTLFDYGFVGTWVQPFVCIQPGTTTGGAKINYIIITQNGAPPVKWEPVLGASPVGVSVPVVGVVVTPAFT